MKVAVLMNSTLAEPSLTNVSRLHELVGVGLGSIGIEDEALYGMEVHSGRVPMRVFKESTHELEMTSWLKECGAEVVLVYTFNFKISPRCLEVPKYGFFNFHPGSLPRDRGNPLFWTILNGRKECTLTVHRMTDRIDQGPVCRRETYPIDGDTAFGAALTELARGANSISLMLLQELESCGLDILLECQEHMEPQYFPRPDVSQIEIDWETQSASDIQALVNACNPFCEGAVTRVEGRVLRILEASPFEGELPNSLAARGVPLSVASGDLCFRCSGESVLRVDVVYDEDGYFSGRKWLRRRAARDFYAIKR